MPATILPPTTTPVPRPSAGPVASGVLSIRGILGADPDVHGRVRVAHAVEVGSDPDAVGRALAVRLRADVDATAGEAPR